jgi:hypothetical protein
MTLIIAKTTTHIGQTGVGSRRSICRGSPKFRAMILFRNFGIFAAQSGEIAFTMGMRHRVPRPATTRGQASCRLSSFVAVFVWKCVVVGVIAFAGSKLYYGRRALSGLGVIVMIAAAFVWADLTPSSRIGAENSRGRG